MNKYLRWFFIANNILAVIVNLIQQQWFTAFWAISSLIYMWMFYKATDDRLLVEHQFREYIKEQGAK